MLTFIGEKAKCASLAQEIGFSAPNSCSLPWLVKVATQLCTSKKECNKSDMTWSSVFLIGPGGLLLVVPTYLQFQLQFLLVGLPKNKISFT
jgi:hypothetical protein